jgi:hypothetical protein
MDFSHLTTQIRALSTQLQCSLSSINLAELIDAQSKSVSGINVIANSLSALDTVISELTSIPVHPYDALLYKHFDVDHNFKTIDDVPDPGHMPYEECRAFLKAKEKEVNKTLFHCLTCKPEEQVVNVFSTLSCGQIICDDEKEKKYLEFFEMVRRIPPSSITIDTYEVISRKILSEFIKCC